MSRESKERSETSTRRRSTEKTPWSQNDLIVEPGKKAGFDYSREDNESFENFEAWCQEDSAILDFQKYVARQSMEFCAKMGDGVQEAMYSHEMKDRFDGFCNKFESHLEAFLEKEKLNPEHFLTLVVKKMQSNDCADKYMGPLCMMACDFGGYTSVMRNESFTHAMERAVHKKLGDKEFHEWKTKVVDVCNKHYKRAMEKRQAMMRKGVKQQGQAMTNSLSQKLGKMSVSEGKEGEKRKSKSRSGKTKK
jgi:hypothetical protein